MPAGAYEVALFFNNSLNRVEATASFSVYQKPTISIVTKEANKPVTINVQGKLSGKKDWAGIYKKGEESKWGNVIAWGWIDKTGRHVLDEINTIEMPAGNYEARLFYNNSFHVEATKAFSVTGAVAPISNVQNAGVNKPVTVTINKHHIDKDWVGIFKKGVEKKWGNEIAWSYVNGKNSVTINPGNKLPAGEYEVALFLDNSLNKVESSVGFRVVGDANNVYGEPGPYINEVNENAEEHGDYFVYYPKNHVQGAPLVLVSGNSGVHDYSGLMKYLASKGCYVVGHRNRKKKKNGDEITEGWNDPVFRYKIFEKALIDVKNLKVDTSRLVTMGHSAGGMVTYKIMDNFKKQGYGKTKSLIIDLEGYYASDMTKNALNSLESDTLMIALGGNTGDQGGASEDPRTLLTLSKLMGNNTKKSFVVLSSKNHGYPAGNYVNILNKKDLIKPIDAMIKYEFFNDNGQYNDAKMILFDDYTETINRVYQATMAKVGDKEPLRAGYAYPCVNPWKPDGTRYDPEINGFGRPFERTIDYCNDHELQ